MNRREALKKTTLAMGGILSLPTMNAFLVACGEKKITENSHFSLSEMQRSIIAEVAEHIIPTTDTPGAKAAGVPAFIEMMIKDCYKLIDQNAFTEGVKELEKSDFLRKTKDEQVNMLKEVEAKTQKIMAQFNSKPIKVGDNGEKENIEAKNKQAIPYWRLMKELTLLGYFTSEIGSTQALDYVSVPGELKNIKLKKGQKSYAAFTP